MINSFRFYTHKLAGMSFHVCLVAALALTGADAKAQTKAQEGRDKGIYVPTIWVDPDGCEHWVMDDGSEGFMTPHVNRQGIPVCRRGSICGMMETDQFFKTNSSRIHARGRARLKQFFSQPGDVAYVITGHTDDRASDEYNLNLSYARADAVADVAISVGANVADVRGFGERAPIATNATAAGMAKNRRVEILCLRRGASQ